VPDEISIAEADLAQFKPEQFAGLIATASDQQLSEVIHGPLRKQVLDEIFGRMADHVEPAQGGGADHYEVVFADGACRATDSPKREPGVTIKVGGVHFLKLAANKASGPVLFMTGKLKLEGDVMLASRLTSFFRIPSAR
jgi:hypothetical protein